jgi:hypothetical protein
VKAYSAIHTPEPGNEFVNQPRQSARRGLDRLIATLGIEDLLNTKIPVDLEKFRTALRCEINKESQHPGCWHVGSDRQPVSHTSQQE